MDAAQTTHWLTLKQAAARLGVDEGTLRHWADSGKVRAFRTPGGHRRFLEEDIRALLAPDASGDVAASMRKGTLLAGRSAQRLRSSAWFAALDEAFREKARDRGRRLVDLIVQSVRGAGVNVSGSVRALGEEYGQELHGSGLTLVQATEAFCLFRDMVLAKVARGGGDGQARIVREVSRLLDEVLFAIVRTYERAGGTS